MLKMLFHFSLFFLGIGAFGAPLQRIQSPLHQFNKNELSSLDLTVIASDIDGTLTSPDRKLSARTVAAVLDALESDALFFPATGKTRQGMFNTVGLEITERLKARGAPAVCIQGLIVYGPGLEEVIYETVLCDFLCKTVVEFCKTHDVSLLAYSGDRIVCDVIDDYIRVLATYYEPEAEAVGPLDIAQKNGMKLHKFILMSTIERVQRLRPILAEALGDSATLVQAMPDMLEVLPRGASKGKGVAFLLNHLGMLPENLLALGDAENDIDMLALAGVGVAMGQAEPEVKRNAHIIAPTNAEDGAAAALETFLPYVRKHRGSAWTAKPGIDVKGKGVTEKV